MQFDRTEGRAGFSSLILLAALVFVCACSHTPQYERGPWGPLAYAGFSDRLNELAGDRAINCGFVDLIFHPAKLSERTRAFRCARSAARAGEPFKYGTLRLPIDSFAWEVLIRAESGDYWLVTYDLMVDGSEQAQWVRRCKAVTMNLRYLSYEGKECDDVALPEAHNKPLH